MRIVEAFFLKSAKSINDSLPQDVAEVAFIGRSNVGKSSLLNSLTNRKNLAKSSATPGKTKLINFFEIIFKDDESGEKYKIRFVDLPGFGYAKVSKDIKKEWQKDLTNFILNRNSIKIFIHLIDARHDRMQIDIEVEEFLNSIKKGDQKILKVFTKIDKLKQNELAKLKNRYREALFVSNLKKTGLKELESIISSHIFGIEK